MPIKLMLAMLLLSACTTAPDAERTDWEITLDTNGQESTMDYGLTESDCRRDLPRWQAANPGLYLYCRYPDY